jgi:NDP-sugar pyrophosphorylase family protein
MLTIVVPAAGSGKRFREAGYAKPKPLIDVCGKPMIQRVMDNVRPSCEHQFIVISRLDPADLSPLLPGEKEYGWYLAEDTQGAVDTILQVKQFLKGPVLLANCDQLVHFDVDDFLASTGPDGSIVTFKSSTPHHSYVTTSEAGIVTAIAEKQVISSQAVTGVYYIADGGDFVDHAQRVLKDDRRYNGEFYTSSALASMIDAGARFRTYDAPSAMLGTPGELQLFEMAVEVGRTL